MEYNILTSNRKVFPASFSSIKDAETFGKAAGFKNFTIVYMITMKEVGSRPKFKNIVHIKTVNKV